MTTKALILQNFEQKIVWLLLASLIFVSIVYVYFVNSSIIQMAIREENEESISIAETEISVLVSEYITLSGDIDMDLATAMGFVDAREEATFAQREDGATTLSLARDEI